MAGRIIRFQRSQPLTPKLPATSLRSVGMAEAPAITLNRMYHWVPRIISGLVQIFTLRWNFRMPTTATGHTRLTGKAARNWATGCTIWATRGRSPIQTPIGTQTSEARAISTRTRTAVTAALPNTSSTS